MQIKSLDFTTASVCDGSSGYAQPWIKIFTSAGINSDMVPVTITQDGKALMQDGAYGLFDIGLEKFGSGTDDDENGWYADIEKMIQTLCTNAINGTMSGSFELWGDTYTYEFIDADNNGMEWDENGNYI